MSDDMIGRGQRQFIVEFQRVHAPTLKYRPRDHYAYFVSRADTVDDASHQFRRVHPRVAIHEVRATIVETDTQTATLAATLAVLETRLRAVDEPSDYPTSIFTRVDEALDAARVFAEEVRANTVETMGAAAALADGLAALEDRLATIDQPRDTFSSLPDTTFADIDDVLAAARSLAAQVRQQFPRAGRHTDLARAFGVLYIPLFDVPLVTETDPGLAAAVLSQPGSAARSPALPETAPAARQHHPVAAADFELEAPAAGPDGSGIG
ncbi:hypothetical protein ACWDUL_21045 [Nocardia niigatensis]